MTATIWWVALVGVMFFVGLFVWASLYLALFPPESAYHACLRLNPDSVFGCRFVYGG